MIAAVMRTWKVRSFWPYVLVCGPMSWWGMYTLGLHPALALVPMMFFVPHAPRSLTLFADRPHSAHDSPRHIEHVLKYPVHVVLFMFGLVNAGVLFTGYGTGSWALLTAALIGKPLGLLMATALAVVMGLHLPRGLHWRDLIVVSLATCGGFAFALFFATAVYPLGPVLGELKIGAILSGVGVPLTIAAAWLSGAGRFKRSRSMASP
jgi:NhaA family Na+:H+ antiporter